jgi:hypothetical protein
MEDRSQNGARRLLVTELNGNTYTMVLPSGSEVPDHLYWPRRNGESDGAWAERIQFERSMRKVFNPQNGQGRRSSGS